MLSSGGALALDASMRCCTPPAVKLVAAGDAPPSVIAPPSSGLRTVSAQRRLRARERRLAVPAEPGRRDQRPHALGDRCAVRDRPGQRVGARALRDRRRLRDVEVFRGPPLMAANRAVPLTGLPGTTGSSVAGSNQLRVAVRVVPREVLAGVRQRDVQRRVGIAERAPSWPEKKP